MKITIELETSEVDDLLSAIADAAELTEHDLDSGRRYSGTKIAKLNAYCERLGALERKLVIAAGPAEGRVLQ